MDRNQFFSALKNGEINSIYLFYGEENYITASALRQMREKMDCDLIDDLNYICVDGKNITADQIVEFCTTISFMATRKLIVVENYPPLVSKEAVDPVLISYIDAPSEDAVLVFSCTQAVAKTGELYKKLNKSSCAVEFSALSQPELIKFISAELRKYEKVMDRDAAAFLIQYSDTELNSLRLELNKLAMATEQAEITRQDVMDIVTPSRDYKIYKITDYIMEKNQSQAIALSDLLISQKEEPIYILAILSKTFHNCVLNASMKKEGKTVPEICKVLGIKDYAQKRLEGYCRRYSEQKLAECSGILLEADEILKTSRMTGRDCLTSTVIKLCSSL